MQHRKYDSDSEPNVTFLRCYVLEPWPYDLGLWP